MIDKSNFRFNIVISPETKYMHLMEALEEARRNFLRAKRKVKFLDLMVWDRVGFRV